VARPTSKIELLKFSDTSFEKLKTFIEELSPSQQESEFPSGTLNRNIRDVLAHLYHWHSLFLNWYEVGMAGHEPDMPARGYSWKSTPDLNKWICQHYQTTSLEEVKTLLNRSSLQIRKIIERHTDDELFEKKKYKWTGTSSLAVYLRGAASSHYEWAFKLIKKAMK